MTGVEKDVKVRWVGRKCRDLHAHIYTCNLVFQYNEVTIFSCSRNNLKNCRKGEDGNFYNEFRSQSREFLDLTIHKWAIRPKEKRRQRETHTHKARRDETRGEERRRRKRSIVLMYC